MPLVLRVDVDKPYGRSGLINRIKSKLAEDYWFPKGGAFNYLCHLKRFIEYCNSESVKGCFYFRTCTIPDKAVTELLLFGKHKAGFHAENTKSFETFVFEFESFKKKSGIDLDSFTKHGSGILKLGKYHYSPYEPEKYLSWARDLKIQFPFGNGICESAEDLFSENGFYPNMFWIEREYRNERFKELTELIRQAKNNIIPVLIHPCNFDASVIVRNDFKLLVRLAKENNIQWTII